MSTTATLRWVVCAALVLQTMACDGEGPSPDGGRDASAPDAGPADAAAMDAGPADAGPSDAGGPDAGPADGGPAYNLVFVTSTTTTGAMGGLAGADTICAERAAAAGLPGTYVAWLSTSTVDAVDRLAGARGWVGTDGRAFADEIADIMTGRIFHPIRHDELGAAIPYVGSQVWAATDVDGTRAEVLTFCADWTLANDESAFRGEALATTGAWTRTTAARCSTAQRLYCFGIDHDAPITPPSEAGRVAFMSAAPFLVGSGGGIAAADGLCQAEADAASLPGTYRAALATTGATISSRFDLDGLPWVRTDGARVAPTAAGLFRDTFLEAPINVQADGVGYQGNYAFWTGAGTPRVLDSPGTATTTCDDWTIADLDYGSTGQANRVAAADRSGGSSLCNFGGSRLLCLEE